MQPSEKLFTYLDDQTSFRSDQAAGLRTIYFPLSGVDSGSLKSSITPRLSGDIKIDKERYLTKPVSTEDLRMPCRQFFVFVDGKGIMSLSDLGKAKAHVEIGQFWHNLVSVREDLGLKVEALNFIPVSGEGVELMRVSVKNISDQPVSITSTAAIPIFGRALSNKHDHEHVTSLLHRTTQKENGVVVSPAMSFDERGHIDNTTAYYVLGITGEGENPQGTFPTVESFCGDGGSMIEPVAVMKNQTPEILEEGVIQGKESVGAIRFAAKVLEPGQSQRYLLFSGIASNQDQIKKTFERFNSREKFNEALEENKEYWAKKSSSIVFTTGDNDFNAWMRWVTIQPVLRRIFGCSFLPDHDYGKGGKGWRDLWQDLLSLILIEPQSVRDNLVNNFAGVRIDGSNATIIGSEPGEFIADRNSIARVWMDHGVWPFMTLKLYIDQTGDFDILFEEVSYFRDAQFSRNFNRDTSKPDGDTLKDAARKEYKGTILEHLLVQNLVQFFNVGEHNITRLENADWNDGLDMAFERGESVTFMSAYGANLLQLADLLETLAKEKKIDSVSVCTEMLILLDSITTEPCSYDDVQAKKSRLFDMYFKSVEPNLSGEKQEIKVSDLISDLRKKGQWIFKHINGQEKVVVEEEGRSYQWFNGYYDNKSKRVEGNVDSTVRMTLTGQVFPVMSGLANKEDVSKVVESVRKYLKDPVLGGFRLNSDFGLKNYLDLGRAFGFAYGTKENGAFFSHMIVMYAYALYERGFVREGHEVLQSIYQMCADTQKSKIYPGIPEYFDSQGRGFYHYLTGSASWLVLTELTQVFGIKGDKGDLVISPKLVKEQFDQEGRAGVHCQFGSKKIDVFFENPSRMDYGEYKITHVDLGEGVVADVLLSNNAMRIKRELFKKIPSKFSINLQLGT